jgi:hypothetical protein
VEASLKGNYNMGLTKCGYTNPVENRPAVTLDRVVNTEDYKNLEKKISHCQRFTSGFIPRAKT